MPLVPCRACGYQVDTSALACPKCGATDPGHKISRQQRNIISISIQAVVIAILLIYTHRKNIERLKAGTESKIYIWKPRRVKPAPGESKDEGGNK